MEYTSINEKNREQINAFISERWFSTEIIIRGESVDMTKVDGIIAMEGEKIAGLLTYVVYGDTCEITSLDSIIEHQGVGSALIQRVIAQAKSMNCKRMILVTTNDNINALRFYQRRGFDMARLYHNALDVSRRMKPSIPFIGNNGILLMHEIEFELTLTQ